MHVCKAGLVCIYFIIMKSTPPKKVSFTSPKGRTRKFPIARSY